MRIDCISDEALFLALRDEWNAVAGQCRDPSPFVRHEWFEAAWRWRRESADLRVLTVRDGADLVAVWPLCTERRKVAGFSVRVLTFITVPDSQLADVVASPERVDDAVAALGRYLSDVAGQWDLLELNRVPHPAPMLATLSGRPGTPHFYAGAGDSNFYVDLRDRWQDYYSSCSKRLRRGNNLIANRLAKRGEVRIDWIRDAE
jgi:CelD/BcsL family acetyltransferase involved in cellulose biosynthesis